MTRTRDTGSPLPPDVDFTLADSLFTAEQNAHLLRTAEQMEAMYLLMLDCMTNLGKTVEAWMHGHPCERSISHALLEPLFEDGKALRLVLWRLQVRISMLAPAGGSELRNAGLALQFHDLVEMDHPVAAAIASQVEQHADAVATVQSAHAVMSACYKAIADSQVVLTLATEAARYRRDHLSGLTADEKEFFNHMKPAVKANKAALDAVTAWRWEQGRKAEARKEARA